MSTAAPSDQVTIISNGLVVDGTCSTPYLADVAIRGSTIERVGDVEDYSTSGRGTVAVDVQRVDADGKLVMPGFIDVHSHDDLAVLDPHAMVAKISQGITTTIIGNCGYSAAPMSSYLEGELTNEISGTAAILGAVKSVSWSSFGSYLDVLSESALVTNIGALVGYGSVRSAIVGNHAERTSRGSIEKMADLVAEASGSGALGISTGLIYPPGNAAELDELVRLAEAIGTSGLYVTHIRNEGPRIDSALEEAVTVADRSARHLHVSHLKASGHSNHGRLREIIAEMSKSSTWTFDVYPYTASSSRLDRTVNCARENGHISGDDIHVARAPSMRDAEGLSVEELRQSWNVDVETALDLIVERSGEGAIGIYFSMIEEDIENAIATPNCMIGTDGLRGAGASHPRLYGTFPRVLRRYILGRQCAPLPVMVHRMTSLPASVFKLGHRGRIAAGMAADVIVVDPEVVADTATFQQPSMHATGIERVYVNGVLSWVAGSLTDSCAGLVIRQNEEVV